jgi:hypothetical protein
MIQYYQFTTTKLESGSDWIEYAAAAANRHRILNPTVAALQFFFVVVELNFIHKYSGYFIFLNPVFKLDIFFSHFLNMIFGTLISGGNYSQKSLTCF